MILCLEPELYATPCCAGVYLQKEQDMYIHTYIGTHLLRCRLRDCHFTPRHVCTLCANQRNSVRVLASTLKLDAFDMVNYFQSALYMHMS